MRAPLDVLAAAGAPLGRGGGDRPAPAQVREALGRVRNAPLDEATAEAIAAWVFGWRGHWPGHFAETIGEDESALVAWAEAARGDFNRYIKLRRIALARLTEWLR